MDPGGTLQGNTVSGGTPLVNVAYGYDLANEPVWRDDEVADAAGQTLDQTYSYDTMERLTGYSSRRAHHHHGHDFQPTLSNSWSLDSEGNRYNNGGTTYGTSYNTANESQSSGTAYSRRGEHDHGHVRRRPIR